MLDIFGAGRALSNYVNHSRHLVRKEGGAFMLSAWRRRASYEALREVEARWLPRVRKHRSAFARLLRDVNARYGGEPIDVCFHADGKLTKRGIARIAQVEEEMPSETICRQIQQAFVGCPSMATRYASALPVWPGAVAVVKPAVARSIVDTR